MIKKNITLVIGALFAFNASGVLSGEIEKFYQVDSRLTYQSNPGFADNDKESVFALKVKPSAQFQYADELNQYHLDIGFAIYKNSNEKVLLDYVAPEIIADWSRELEFGQIGLEAKYNEVASRQESLRLNGVNADVENVTDTASIKGIFNLDFNAHFSLNNFAEYTNIEYSEDTNNLNDYELIGGSSQLVYKKNDFFSSYAKATYTDLNPSGATKDSDVYALLVGGIYTPSENIKVDLALGGYDASGRFDDSGLQVESNGLYVYNRTALYYNLHRKMVPGGNGVFQMSEYVGIGGKYQLSEVEDLRVGYSRNESTPDRDVSSFDVIYDSISFSYERTYEDWKAAAFVDFVGLDLDGDQRRQNVVGLLISFDPFDFNDLRRNPLNF